MKRSQYLDKGFQYDKYIKTLAVYQWYTTKLLTFTFNNSHVSMFHIFPLLVTFVNGVAKFQACAVHYNTMFNKCFYD